MPRTSLQMRFSATLRPCLACGIVTTLIGPIFIVLCEGKGVLAFMWKNWLALTPSLLLIFSISLVVYIYYRLHTWTVTPEGIDLNYRSAVLQKIEWRHISRFSAKILGAAIVTDDGKRHYLTFSNAKQLRVAVAPYLKPEQYWK